MDTNSHSWQEIASQLKTSTWDIVADWLEAARGPAATDRAYITLSDEEIIGHMPTLVGGVARAIADPASLADLEADGSLHAIAHDFGRARHQAGYQIDRVMADFSLLRARLGEWSAQAVLPNGATNELQRRVNTAVDRMLQLTIEAYHRSAAIELMELSHKDKLTGCLNLKALTRLIEQEVARARRYHQPLTMGIIDIDNFRRFNLKHGRLEGNRLLRDLGRTIVQSIRSVDYTARLGGDEFAVLFPQIDADQGWQAAERIRRQIRQEHDGDRLVTVSIGLASSPAHADGKDELLEQSRAAVALAQKEGGDITVVAPPTRP